MPKSGGIWRVSMGNPPPPMLTLAPPDLSAVPFDALDGARLLGLGGAPPPAPSAKASLRTPSTRSWRSSTSRRRSWRTRSTSPCARSRAAGRLAPDESDRLLRAASLAEMAIAALGTAAAAGLAEPRRLLGDESPLQHADTALGARAVEDMLYAVDFSAPA